jgi:phosphatidate cytidylyltransferase
MTRVLSGAVLIALVVAIVWIAPPAVFYAAAGIVTWLAFREYVVVAAQLGLRPPVVLSWALTLIVCTAVALQLAAIELVMMTGFVAIAATILARGVEPDSLAALGASIVPALYLGVPLGALVAMRILHGPAVVFLLMLAIMVSDTAQYYTGRAFGRHKLAPGISPKKTVEGAVGGFVFGAATMVVAGGWWLPAVAGWMRLLLGVAIVALGIAGDLFESLLKRAAGVKDSSALIPGHGGVLDRIDALLFAAPVYYLVLRYL